MSVNLPLNFNPGAFPDRPDNRDRRVEAVCTAPVVDWEKGYNVETSLGINLTVEDQNGSSSCVGQAFGKYTEVINYVETKVLVNHSPKSIYEQIYLPGGGAYLRDGAKTPVNGGVALESWVPSYINGQPPTEEYMRKPLITDDIRDKMKVYQAKEYRTVGTNNVDLIAWTIENNHGAVSGAYGDNEGWKDWIVKPPKSGVGAWGHAIYYFGFGLDERRKYFDFINSWGTSWGKLGKGRMYFEEYDMPNNTFGFWTLIDKPNTSSVDPIALAYLKKHEDEIIFNSDIGNFGLSLGDKLLELKDWKRGGLMALMKMVRGTKTSVPDAFWKKFPIEDF